MRILIAQLENFILGEKTFLSDNIEQGEKIIPVKNAGNFKVNGFIVLGIKGKELAEIRTIEGISEDLKEITLVEGTRFKHSKNEPIQEIMFDMRRIYRSDDGENYYHLGQEGSPVNIQVDIPEGTRFEDSSGTDKHYYKATYFNSFSITETNLEDAISAKAGDADHYTSIYKIREEAGMADNHYISGEIIDNYRRESEAEVEAAIAHAYKIPIPKTSKLLQRVVTLLSAGYLLAKEYALDAGADIGKTGERKIERAHEILEKIKNGEYILTDADGNRIDTSPTVFASSSNRYREGRIDKGAIFNLEDEHFKMTDPNEPLQSSRRKDKKRFFKK